MQKSRKQNEDSQGGKNDAENAGPGLEEQEADADDHLDQCVEEQGHAYGKAETLSGEGLIVDLLNDEVDVIRGNAEGIAKSGKDGGHCG